jgi:hypothetical protein
VIIVKMISKEGVAAKGTALPPAGQNRRPPVTQAGPFPDVLILAEMMALRMGC